MTIKEQEMKIKIVHEQHFIEGNEHKAFLISGSNQIICLTAGVKDDGYLDMCESINGIKFRLEQLGCNVEVVNVVEPDHNFDTAADAEEYLMNKGE